MRKAIISRAVVIQDDKTKGTVLLGVAETSDAAMNFKVPYDWETLDYDWFIAELKDTIARELDVASSEVEMMEDELFRRMSYYHKQLSGAIH